MTNDVDVAERVWAETWRLAAVAPSADVDLRRLQAGLGYIAGRLAQGPERRTVFPAQGGGA